MEQFGSRKSIIDGYQVIELFNEHQSVSIAVDLGNNLYHWSWKGKNIIWFPHYLQQYQSSKSLAGIPLMYPWANRLGADYFTFEGTKYLIENNQQIVRDTNELPIHGLLLKSDKWQVKEVGADEYSAWYISEYINDENSEIFLNYPFLHSLNLIYRLKSDKVEISLTITNHDEKNLPVSFGFHPYFSLEQYNREQVVLNIPYQNHVITDASLLPTGAFEPAENLLAKSPFPLKKFYLDDGFVNKAVASNAYFETEDYRLEIVPDENFRCVVVYAPYNNDKMFICIEPMIVPTNSLQNSITDFPVPYIAPGISQEYSFEIILSDR
ncbi:MAG: aldose 1-epimerase [Chitinophagales bacterium]|nr:aldose 1-epimerase [Chitinophagales bacterium]